MTDGGLGERVNGARRPLADDVYQRPSALAQSLDVGLLEGQFVLSRDRDVAPPEWQLLTRDGWFLAHDSGLPVTDLIDRSGAEVGWLLGHPIDVEARTFAVRPRLPAAVEDAHFVDEVEAWLARLAGRYAAIVTGARPFVVPDAFGSLPVLFDPVTGHVSSSPLLLPGPDGGIPDSELVDELAIYRTATYFPLGLTCHATARMLLPSHVADLGSFEQRRMWPRGPLQEVDLGEAVPRTAELLGAAIEGANANGDAWMSLTAGGDSRLLLACSRRAVDRLRFFTVPQPDLTGRTDVRVATQIARRLGLDHRVLEWIEPTDADVRTWMTRTGALTGEYRGRRAGPTYAQLGGGPYVAGIGPEIARARKWRKSDTATTSLGPRDLLARLALPSGEASVRACQRWLEDVPPLSAVDVIDLFFLEICHGGWAGPMTFGYPEGTATTIYPFAQREILELALGLPHEARRGDRLRKEITAREWPELAEFAVNKPLLRHTVRDRSARISSLPAGMVRRVRRRALARGG